MTWRIFPLLGVLTTLVLLTGCLPEGRSPAASAVVGSRWAIESRSVGPLSLGMTIPEARRALGAGWRLDPPPARPILVPDAAFRVRDSSGKEVARVFLTDTLNPLKPGNTIGSIEAVAASCETLHGVRPSQFVTEVTAVYGQPTFRQHQDVGTETVSFARQPAGLTFFVADDDGSSAGIYDPRVDDGNGHWTSQAHHATARITAIAVGTR